MKVCGKSGLTIPEGNCEQIAFEGVDDITIPQGAEIDLAEGVSAYDAEGNEIPFSFYPTSIPKCEVGDYTITYSAIGKGRSFAPTICGHDRIHIDEDCSLASATKLRVVTVEQADLPTINGVQDVIVEPGSTFNLMDGVSGEDALGNPVEVHLVGAEAEQEFDTEGIYDFFYTAEDSCGNVAEVNRVIYVQTIQYRFVGIEDETLNQGEDFSLTDGITAYNSLGEEVPYTVSPNTIDTCDTGTFTFTYTVGMLTRTRTITINESKPSIYGVDTTIEVGVGEVFDPLEDVLAFDGNGNPLVPTVKKGRANLIPYPYCEGTVTKSGVTFTDLGDGRIRLDGTATGYVSYNLGSLGSSCNVFWLERGDYIIEGSGTNDIGIGVFVADDPPWSMYAGATDVSFQMLSRRRVYTALDIVNGATFDGYIFEPKLIRS